MRAVVRLWTVVTLAWLAACGARADVLLDWERQYHVAPGSESFASTVMDDLGNVYAIGKTFNGSNDDALVVKYGPAGSLHWAIKFTGAGDQVGQGIAVKPDGSELYITYASRPGRIVLRRINPLNGSSTWVTYRDGLPGESIDQGSVLFDPTTGRVFWGFWWGQSGGNATLWALCMTSGGGLVQGYGAGLGPGCTILDVALRPQGGAFYLSGDRTIHPPGTRLLAVNEDGGFLGTRLLDTGTALGVGPAQGGVLVVAGRFASNRITITRFKTSDLSQVAWQDTFTGLTDVTVNDAVVGPGGEAYVLGAETVAGKGTEWFMSRYAYPTNVRDWRTTRPNTTASESFLGGSVDAYGSLAVAAVRKGATDQLLTKVYDCATGNLLGESTTNSPSGAGTLSAIATNASSVFSASGLVQDAGFTRGLLTRVSQDGLRRLSVPLNAYTGGFVPRLSIWMYGATGAIRSVGLSSNSPYVLPPATASVLALVTLATLDIPTVPTNVDRTVELTASFQGAIRKTRFILLAPRPASLDITPSSVNGGEVATGTIQLTGLAPTGGLVVSLQSNGPDVVVPSFVTVSVGQAVKTFAVVTLPTIGTVTRTVTATANGVSKTDTITVHP